MISTPAATEGAEAGAAQEAVPVTARCRATSPSSWTATAAGPRSAGCRASPGHRAGAEAVRTTLQAAAKAGVEVLTLYAFSSENWRRSEEEVSDLKGLLAYYRRQGTGHARQRGRPAPADRRSIGVRSRARPAPGACRRADRRQYAPDPGRRAQLWRAGRNRRRRPHAGRGCRGRAPRSGFDRRAGDRRGARHGRPARSGPAHPHVRRIAAVQFPAVAGGLCRIAVRRHLVAGLRRGGLRRRPEPVRRPAAAVRRAMNELVIRSIAGIVLIAVRARRGFPGRLHFRDLRRAGAR